MIPARRAPAAPLDVPEKILAELTVQEPDAEVGAALKRFVELVLVAYGIVQRHVESPPFRGKSTTLACSESGRGRALRIAPFAAKAEKLAEHGGLP